jgi:anti-sigma B factor antagonist
MTNLHKTTVIEIENDFFDAAQADKFRVKILQAWEKGIRHFIVDMKNVKFIDSSGIGALLFLYKTCGSEGTLQLTDINPQVMNTFTLVNLTSLFKINKNTESALSDLKNI